MGKLNTLKGILKMKVQRLHRELELLHYEGSMAHYKYVELETQISTLKETIDIIDTL